MADITVQRGEPRRGLPARGDLRDMLREMARWDPFSELLSTMPTMPTAFVPDFDVKETEKDFRLKADLPGVKADDLDINLRNNRLTVSGKREEERTEEEGTYYCSERSYGEFARAFTLPDGGDADNISANLKDGVLEIKIPKRPEAQPKRIQVGSSS